MENSFNFSIPEIKEEQFPASIQIPENLEYHKIASGKISTELDNSEASNAFYIEIGKVADNIKISKDIFLICAQRLEISCGENAPLATIEKGNVVFKNFTFLHNSNAPNVPAILINGGNVLFENCTFQTNPKIILNTIIVNNDAKVVFKSCQIHGSMNSNVECNNDCVVSFEQSYLLNSEKDVVLASGNSQVFIKSCNVGKANGNSFLMKENSRICICYTKVHTCDCGINIESSSTTLNDIRNVEFDQVRRYCILCGSNSKSQILNSVFPNSRKTTLKCTDDAQVRLSKNNFMSSRATRISASKNSLVESLTDNISGKVEIKDHSIVKASQSIFQAGSIVINKTSEFYAQNCTINGIQDYAIMANNKSKLFISQCQISKSGGILCRTTEAINISNTVIADCDCGIDLGGGTQCQLNNLQIKNSRKFGIYAQYVSFLANNVTIEESKLIGVDLNYSIATFTNCNIIKNQEGGMAVREKSFLIFNEGCSSKNSFFGVFVSEDGFLKSDKAKFTENIGFGIVSVNGSCKLNEVEFNSNGNSGIQQEGDHSVIIATKSKFYYHVHGSGLFNSNNSKAYLKECNFAENGVHIETEKCTQNKIERCTFTKSKDGVGVFARDNSRVTIIGCNFVDESKTAILSMADVNVKSSRICNCGISGIIFMNNSKGSVEKCTIDGNKKNGIHVASGEPLITGNNVLNNLQYGIALGKESKAEVQSNSLQNNHAGDVVNLQL